MKKLQLYIETSVWNFLFADDAPEKREITCSFFNKVKNGEYEIFISDIVIKEIDKAIDDKKHELLAKISEIDPIRLEVNEYIVKLAENYIKDEILPQNKIEDAMHAAIATFYEMDALITWNFKHLANLKKMDMINGINLKEGYSKRLELITPMEVSDEEI